MTTNTTKPVFTTEEKIIDGNTVTIVQWNNDMNFSSDDQCCICKLKVRGSHSYAVHLSVNGYLLPVEGSFEESQGFFSVGAECRKQLPATHSVNTKGW